MARSADIIIIGAGPAGLSAAVNAVARGKSVRILSGGGSYLEKAEQVDNHLGMWNVSGEEMMEQFRSHVQELGLTIEQGRVGNVMSLGQSILVNWGGEILEAGAVIVATGAAKGKPLPGEAELLGRGVSYCATCDGMLYRGRRVVVTGTAEDLAEEANFLQGIGVQVEVIIPRPRPEHLHPDVTYRQGVVREILAGQQGTVSGVRTMDGEVPAEGVFLLRSAIAPTALVAGIAMQDGFIQVDRHMATNLPGIYAAGDCTGEPLQVSKAVGEGLIAAQSAARYLDQMEQANDQD